MVPATLKELTVTPMSKPAAASATAVARPIPESEPVTMATLMSETAARGDAASIGGCEIPP